MELKDPIQIRKVRFISRVLLMTLSLIVFGCYVWRGSTTAKGALIGCLVVVMNYFISREFLKKVIFSDKLPVYSIIFYVAKLGGSVAIIYLSIKTDVDLVGLMIGLSSFWVTTVLSICFKVGKSTQNEAGESEM